MTVVLRGKKLADTMRKVAAWCAIARSRWPFAAVDAAERLAGDLGWLGSVDSTLRLHLRGIYRAIAMAHAGGYSTVCLREHQPARADLDGAAARMRGGLRGLRLVPSDHVAALVVEVGTVGAPTSPEELLLQARLRPAAGVAGTASDASLGADGRRSWSLITQGRAERGDIPAGHPLANAWADELELFPVLHALRTRTGLDGRLLLILTDSASNAYRINAGAARYGTEALRMLQEIYDIADARGISLLAFWAPRSVNGHADALADPDPAAPPTRA